MACSILPLCVAVLVPSAAPAFGAEPLEFNRDVRPILSQNCFACHGFDAKQRKADLRLDVPEGAFAEHDGSAAIRSGQPEQSEVWRRINTTDADEVMPPQASHKKLTAAEKTVIRRWIEQGAPYQKHWAFEPVRRAAEPAVKNQAWPRNAVDRFILARLEKEQLAPQAEADRETLIRRVSFLLTGLPPTLEEIDRYVNDKSGADKSNDAYEQMVDRYLASPRYGEERARYWLDVARYADTHGLHLDNERQMWAYRDWVIDAFNNNLPYDQFTVWQLAGDLLPNPTNEQLTATGFNRCNVTTSEGGAIADEYAYRYAVERASTTIQTWLGLTGGCAVCHDHKYDPISAREFYSFYAFFNNAADPAMDGNVNNTAPFQKLPEAGQQASLDATTKHEAAARRALEDAATQAKYTDPAQAAATSEQSDAESSAEIELTTDVVFDDFFPLGAVLRNTSRNAPNWIADPPFGAPSGRRVLKQANSHFFEDTVQSQLLPVIVPEDGRFEVWLRVDPENVPDGVSIVLGSTGGTRRVWWGNDDALDGGFPGIAQSERIGPLPEPGQWTRLIVSAKDFGLKAGQRVNSIALQQAGGVVYWDAFAVQGIVAPEKDPLASFTNWWQGVGQKAPADVPAELQAILTAGPKKEATPELRAKLQNFYLAYVARPVNHLLATRRREWESARAARSAAEYAMNGTMIYRDRDAPKDSFVMMRGQYDKPGDKVEPAVPAVFPALKKASTDGRATRLDLARWLVAPEHPLTARVEVNRLWQEVFGTGLVKTSYDFGSQGEVPSHPELLDWLASEYRDSGWDTKRLLRLLVTSATFRQRAYAGEALRQRDPENRLLARGPRFRLDAEQIRDAALFTAGLINLDMGGPGVKPYQPPNIWEPVGYGDSNTRYYLQDHGASLYRRSLYVFLKRTAPPPFMSNFDAPNREQFCTRRERSNTPLQALQLMNDVQFFEAARALAERAIDEGGKTPEARITYLYRVAVGRRPDPAELKLVAAAYAKQLRLFQEQPRDASRAVSNGESVPRQLAPDTETAAWTLVANLILNLDETVNRN
ncbi:MAG: DUF1553 domain-containing protein [Planctomycetes bacterium]|nr:DUF1553 domain-containing protein [Planctomycetota bacterium]